MQTNLKSFQIQSEGFEPAYMKLFHSGELYRRHGRHYVHWQTAKCVHAIAK